MTEYLYDDLGFYYVLEAINKYKQEKIMNYRMQIFIDYLFNEKNLILIENTIIFIICFV